MNSKHTYLFVFCPECGASNRDINSHCWICNYDLHSSPGEQTNATYDITAELVPEHPRGRFQFSIMSTLLLVAFVAIGLGTWKVWPRYSLLVLFVGCPSLLATIIRSSRRKQTGEKATAVDTLLLIFTTSIVLFGVYSLLAVAAMFLLFALCFRALTAGV